MELTSVSEGLSRLDILGRLKESHLISQADLERTASARPDDDGIQLCNALLTAGLLTPYQVEAVLQNRMEELKIGNYDVLDKLGAGGMGTVFKARHRRMKRVVALKVLSRTLCSDETFVQRFQREVETIARLSHPNIVMAYDADESDIGHFLVMEFVNGQDLASLVHKQGPSSVLQTVDCILQSAKGLAYAHGQQIIHRDIKPANLLCDVSGTVKVTDLGLARLNTAVLGTAGNSGITQAGGILGTVDYMPPEQAVDSTTIDHRADIYSLGATLYFLLLGQAPYHCPTVMGTLLKHREAPIPSLTALRSDVPAPLDQIFKRALAKDPAQRYQTMAEVVTALEAIHAGLLQTSPAPVAVALPAQPTVSRPTDVRQSRDATVTPAPEMSAQTVDLRPPSTAHGKQVTILLVEPSRTQAAIIRKYLHGQDVENVITVGSGQEALKIVRSQCPTAIVSALHLPDMTGIQLAKEARQESQGALSGFVLISSEAESEEAGTLSKAGLAVLLQKPFTPEQLIQALSLASPKSVLGRSPLSAPLPPVKYYGHLRVLIVDDGAAARAHIRSVLSEMGVTQFVEATDGAQAIAAVATDRFGLIVTDYNMPFLDGRGLVGYLKQNPATASVPIIMVTTEKDPAKLKAVRDLGVLAVCEKSFPAADVRKILESI